MNNIQNLQDEKEMNFSMLNEMQLRAVNSKSKRILCLAGAGTGKTKTLISRVQKILKDGISPSSILCLTFTRMAGFEMKKRLGESGKNIFINTFHSFCSQIIRDNYDVFKLKEGYNIYTQNEREIIIKDIIKENKMEKEKIKIENVLKCLLEDTFNSSNIKYRKAKNIEQAYRKYLKTRNSTDIDLLILDVVKAFKTNKQLCDKYHEIYKYIFIDEFQDTNDNQMSFIESINPEYLFLVGDDYQSIYGFNGAKVKYILDISHDVNYEIIKLEENYRSTIPIIKTANKLISNNINRTEKKLISYLPGDNVIYGCFENFNQEVCRIIEIIKKKGMEKCCIITRLNSQIKYIEDILKKQNIDYNILGEKESSLESKDGKNIVNLLDSMINPYDNLKIKEILEIYEKNNKEKIIINALDKNISYFEAALQENKYNVISLINKFYLKNIKIQSISNVFIELLNNDFIKNNFNIKVLGEMLFFLEKWEITQKEIKCKYTTEEFIFWFKTKTSSDIEFVLKQGREKGLTLTTAHSSKGLEFPIVFMVGMNEDIFPYKKDDIEESRRLCYVAITRAKKELYVSWSKSKIEKWNGQLIYLKKSRFVQEMKIE